jgi:hypothetical protein
MLQQCGHHGQGNRWSQMFVLSCEPASGQIAGRGASHRSWYSPEVRHPCAPRLHLPGWETLPLVLAELVPCVYASCCVQVRNLHRTKFVSFPHVVVVLIVSGVSKTASKSIKMGGVHIRAAVSRTLHMSAYVMV